MPFASMFFVFFLKTGKSLGGLVVVLAVGGGLFVLAFVLSQVDVVRVRNVSLFRVRVGFAFAAAASRELHVDLVG